MITLVDPPAPIRALARRSADKPKRSRARPSLRDARRADGGGDRRRRRLRRRHCDRGGQPVLMLEHAIYSVISPEGAASILWKDSAKAQDAANAMKITAQDLMRFDVIDAFPEPFGGAHRDPGAAVAAVGTAIGACASRACRDLDREAVRRQRREKFLNIGRSPVTSAAFDAGLPFVHHFHAGTPDRS